MLKETFVALSVATLATGAAVLPMATANAAATAQVQIAASDNPCNPCNNPCAAANPCNPCNPCAAANPCNPCNPCLAANPCNPCAATNPCNPCAAANPCNPCNPC